MEKELLQVCEVKLIYRPKIKASQRYVVKSSKDAYDLLKECYDDNTLEYKEYFKVLLLNTSNKVLGVVPVSEGGLIGTVVDIKQILQPAILTNAVGMVLSHNHPSMSIKPSSEDIKITKRIIEAAKIMDIKVIDHIIVCEDSYYSFADEGQI